MSKLFVSLGTGPGIGLETARHFALQGFDIVVVARNTDRIQSIAESIKQASGRNVEAVTLDVTDHAGLKALAARLGGRVGVVHYNAAVLEETKLEETLDERFAHHCAVDIGAAIAAVRAFSLNIESGGGGTILLTGGGFALYPNADYLALSIGKAGIRCMAQALFEPLSKRAIHIATLTVCKLIAPNSAEALSAAEAFWQLHTQEQSDWHWEALLQ